MLVATKSDATSCKYCKLHACLNAPDLAEAKFPGFNRSGMWGLASIHTYGISAALPQAEAQSQRFARPFFFADFGRKAARPSRLNSGKVQRMRVQMNPSGLSSISVCIRICGSTCEEQEGVRPYLLMAWWLLRRRLFLLAEVAACLLVLPAGDKTFWEESRTPEALETRRNVRKKTLENLTQQWDSGTVDVDLVIKNIIIIIVIIVISFTWWRSPAKQSIGK